ncbi:hypothetical protein OAG62_00525 [bacterium]|nr:hypothetical protein [bacterium]
MPALPDGVEAMDQWIRSIPTRQQAKGLEACQFLIPADGALEGPFVSVPSSAAEFFAQYNGRPESSLPSGDGWDSISASQLPDRLLLQPSDETDPPSSLLILVEDHDPESFAELLSGLTLIPSKHQVLLSLESESGTQATAIELVGADHRDLSNGSLGPIEILQIRDIGFRTATPLGLVHPMAEKTPSLLRINNPHDSLLIWRPDPTDDRKGRFISMKLAEQRTRIPADFFKVVSEQFPTTLIKNQVMPPEIEIHLERTPVAVEEDQFRTSRVLLELKDTSNGQGFRRLLDIMDEVESGVLDQDARIWTSRLGKGAASPTTHHISFRTDRPASEFAARGIRAYAQPEAFDSRSIPLYIEAGYSLRPAIDTLLDRLPTEHPLIRQLGEEFPATSDDRPCHHFLRVNPHGTPSHQVLTGGELLIDHIGTIVAEVLALPPDASRDTAATKKLAEEIRGSRKRSLENIRTAGKEESDLIRSEFDSVHADLLRHVSAIETKIKECSTKAMSLSEIATSLEQSLAKTPAEWWNLQKTVETINAKIIEPRATWLKQIETQKTQVWDQQKQVLKELSDSKSLVSSRLKVIQTWLTQAEESRRELDRVLTQAQVVQRKLTTAVTQASKHHKTASLILEEVSGKLDLETQRLAEAEQALLRRQQAIAARQRELEVKKTAQGQAEKLADQRSTQIDGEYDQLSKRKVRLEAELNRIDQIETQEIPKLERSCNSLQKRLEGYDKEALEKKSRNLSDRRARLNAELQSIQRTEEDLQFKEAANRGVEAQIREAKDLLEGREKKLHDRRVDQESRRKNLERRRRKLDAAEEAARERERQDNAAEEELQRKEGRTTGIWERGGRWIRRIGGRN